MLCEVPETFVSAEFCPGASDTHCYGLCAIHHLTGCEGVMQASFFYWGVSLLRLVKAGAVADAASARDAIDSKLPHMFK